MAKLWLTLVLCSIVSAIQVVHGISLAPQDVEKWFENLHNLKEKTTKLHFYFHDKMSDPNPTVVQVANSTLKSATAFGLTFMADDPMTVGPEPNSKMIGRAQGIFSFADQNEYGLYMSLNLFFTDGEFNGSTLSLLGRNPIFHEYREMSIVGGSGVFRLARGIATAKTYFLDLKKRDAIVKYDVIVLHY